MHVDYGPSIGSSPKLLKTALIVFSPDHILHNVKTGSISGHFRLLLMTRTPTILKFQDFSLACKRVWVDSSSRQDFYRPILFNENKNPSLKKKFFSCCDWLNGILDFSTSRLYGAKPTSPILSNQNRYCV